VSPHVVGCVAGFRADRQWRTRITRTKAEYGNEGDLRVDRRPDSLLLVAYPNASMFEFTDNGPELAEWSNVGVVRIASDFLAHLADFLNGLLADDHEEWNGCPCVLETQLGAHSPGARYSRRRPMVAAVVSGNSAVCPTTIRTVRTTVCPGASIVGSWACSCHYS